MKYILTETKVEQSPNNLFGAKYATPVHIETFAKHGAAVLFIRNWFKARGAFRTPQRRQGRTIQPKEYTTADYEFQFDYHKVDDWNTAFTPGALDKCYSSRVRYFIDRRHISSSSEYTEWGVPFVKIYPIQSKWKGSYVILWLKVTDDDGNEIIDSQKEEEDEWI